MRTHPEILARLHAQRPQRHLRVQRDDLGPVGRARFAPVPSGIVVVEPDEQREVVDGCHGFDRLQREVELVSRDLSKRPPDVIGIVDVEQVDEQPLLQRASRLIHLVQIDQIQLLLARRGGTARRTLEIIALDEDVAVTRDMRQVTGQEDVGFEVSGSES